jgi:sensor histidine kinase YesM
MKKKIFQFLKVALIQIFIGIIISLIFSRDLGQTFRYMLNGIPYSLSIGLSLWYGNGYLMVLFRKRMSLTENPLRYFNVGLVLLSVFSILDILLVNYAWVCLIEGENLNYLFSTYYYIIISELIVTLMIISFFYFQVIFRLYIKTSSNEEALKRETLALKYEALKNQVNPHFLFNSLNCLTGLVHADPDRAVKFTKQLSEIYRYVLEQKDKDVVELATEMKFVESYVFLQKTRFMEHFAVNIGIGKENQFKVIPISIQILVENAINHNAITEDTPLKIDIYIENDDYLVVRNNLNPKTTIKESTRIGLQNLKERYEYLTNRSFEIIKTEMEFKVKVPLINAYESSNN